MLRVIVKLEGKGRAFCAGGNVAAVVRDIKEGEYVELVGARLDGAEMLPCDLATHFVPAEEIEAKNSKDDWISTTLQSLKKASPMSLKISLRSWNPSKLEQISDEMVDCYFSKVDDEEWEDLKLPPRSNLPAHAIAKL
ncbi:hypothetical protein LguiB_012586 [Lonicera macranthoides]